MSVHGERAKLQPLFFEKYKSSLFNTVPTPIFKSKPVFRICSIAFFACLLLKVISKFLIPESKRHLAKSDATE